MMTSRRGWKRSAIVGIVVLSAAAALLFGMRTYRSWLLLRSAYALDAPDLGNIRGWMTLAYLSRLYGAPEAALIERLQLPADTAPTTTLRSLAQQAGVHPLEYVQRVQQAIAAGVPNTRRNRAEEPSGGLGAFSEQLLAALLLYGYPALAATLVLGSIGLPLPDGLLTAAAGSLIAQHRMSWPMAGAIAVGATVAGDMVGYGVGLALGREFLVRRGGWFGFTAARQQRAERLFERWGWAGVLLTRTLASSVSSIVNVIAGASRYRPAGFLAAAALGRVLWTAAYLALGYGAGGALEAANGFLTNLTGLLVSLAAALWAARWLVPRQSAMAPEL